MAVKNLVSGVLAQSITASTTNVLVNIAENIDASGIQSFFPTPPFYITIMPKNPTVGVANRLDSEILQVTSVGNNQSGNASLTCVRGQRDTTAKAFDVGSIVTVGVYADDAVFLADSGVSGGSTYRKKLVDKDGNTIIPIMGYMGTVYNATLSSATAGGRADYEFTPDTPVENNKVYAVMFPAPTVNNATIILGDGVVSGSILVPPVSATDSPNYELLTTDMINDTEPLLLMYNGVQWVCLNQKNKVATADLEDKAVNTNNIDWATIVTFTQGGKSDKTLTTTSQTLLQTPTLAPGRYIVFAKVGANVTGYNTDLGDLLASVDDGAHMEKFTAHSAWNQAPLVVNQYVSLTSSGTIKLTCWRGNSNGTIVATMDRCSIFTMKVA